jgi:hypothetical protein
MTPDAILATVEQLTGYSLEQLCFGGRQIPPLTRARFVAMWLLRNELGLMPQAVSTLLCRDRKLVDYGVRVLDSEVLRGNRATLRLLAEARVMLREARAA